MSIKDISKITEWETDDYRLVKLLGLPKSPNFPAGLATRSKYVQIPNRPISRVFIHHSAGPFKRGIDAAYGIAEWVSRAPLYGADGKRKGGGRGWPGAPYQFVIPSTLEVVEGKYEIYRMWDDDMWTWHTSSSYNKTGIGVCMAGWFASRHVKSDNARLEPSPEAFEGLKTLVLDYLLPRYGLTTKALCGHFDAGKPTCPGDFLEQWVRQTRGEKWVSPLFAKAEVLDDKGPVYDLKTTADLQKALQDLGYNLGPHGVDGKWGFDTRAALEAFQEEYNLVPDGILGPLTKAAILRALREVTPR